MWPVTLLRQVFGNLRMVGSHIADEPTEEPLRLKVVPESVRRRRSRGSSISGAAYISAISEGSAS